MTTKSLKVNYNLVESSDHLPVDEKKLVEEARAMCGKAYAPYSAFFVGAAILLENGKTVLGSNQENGAYPSGLCAERVAAFAASSMYPGIPMKKIAISARTNRQQVSEPVSPCGACRQVLLEYETLQKGPMKVILSKESGSVITIEKAGDLLPLSFTGEQLKKPN